MSSFIPGVFDPYLWDQEGDWPFMPNLLLIAALQAYALGFPQSRNRKDLTLFRAAVSNLVLAHQAGKWVSYSRNAEFYRMPRQYRTAEHSYGRMLLLVDLLHELQLIEEQRQLPHRYGVQSRMRATPKLVEAVGHLANPRWEPLQLIELRHAK